jgi:hypothetical protein
MAKQDPKKTTKPAAKPAEKKRTLPAYKPDALQKMRYAMAPYVPFSKETAAESRKTDSIMDSNEMMRLRDKLGYEKKKGGAMKKMAKGGSTKKK